MTERKAPGGMSMKALRAELAESTTFSADYIDLLSWPDLIDHVAEARKVAEIEAAPASLITDPETYDYTFEGHAGAGPSASERWMNCTASLAASRKFLETLSPRQQHEFAQANTAARQGTTAHAAAEAEASVMLGQMDQSELDATLLELSVMPDEVDEAYNDEMAEFITEYTDLVKTYIDSRGDKAVLIEARVGAVVPLLDTTQTDVADPTGEVHVIEGSADFIASPTEEEPELVVGDLKYGNGIFVDVDENPQVRIYGLAALDLLTDDEGNLVCDVEKITYYIIQPRLGGIRSWTESVEDLLTWRDEVLSPALSLALVGTEGGATFNPSEVACQWCPVRGSCPALAEQRIEAAADLFDTIVEAEFADGPGAFPETTTLNDTRLGELLTQINGLVNIQKDLKAEAQRRLYRGEAVPGFKLVSYTPPRKWKSEAEEELADVDDVWKRSLITPKQALLLLSKGDEAAAAAAEMLIDSPDKRPVVAPEGDRRKDWTGAPPEQMFDVEEEA